jgi:hypothetical protein
MDMERHGIPRLQDLFKEAEAPLRHVALDLPSQIGAGDVEMIALSPRNSNRGVDAKEFSRMLVTAKTASSTVAAEAQARAIFASIAGVQLMPRSRSEIGLFDSVVGAYREAGLLPV